QRVGLCNRYYFNLDKALGESKALFFMMPKNNFTTGDLEKFDNYLKSGGKIFIFDHGGEGSSADQFLEKYGLRLVYRKDGKGIVKDRNSDLSFPISTPVGLIRGEGETLLSWMGERDETSYPILVKKRV